MRQTVSDGSVLEYEPADDKAMRAFRKITAPPCDIPAFVNAHEVSANQQFHARRLLTAADEIGLDADTKFNAHDRALAVRMALFAMATSLYAVAESVIEAMPPTSGPSCWLRGRCAGKRTSRNGSPPDNQPLRLLATAAGQCWRCPSSRRQSRNADVSHDEADQFG